MKILRFLKSLFRVKAMQYQYLVFPFRFYPETKDIGWDAFQFTEEEHEEFKKRIFVSGPEDKNQRIINFFGEKGWKLIAWHPLNFLDKSRSVSSYKFEEVYLLFEKSL